MFHIGDKIFYPVHGGGIVEGIEEKETFGETRRYYIVNLIHKNMQVMIPVTNTDQLKIRQIVNPEKLDQVLGSFHEGETDMAINNNQRYRMNLSKVKSGYIDDEIEVMRDLVRINSKRKLGTMDKGMLDNVRQILISEMVLVKDISPQQAGDLLDGIINSGAVAN